MHSDHSRSPNASTNSKQSITPTSNHRISSCSRNASPVLSSSSQNHTTEAVPRTHSSNKRLRKEESGKEQRYQSSHGIEPMVEEVPAKKQRLNGENISGNLNSQVPSPTLKERISSAFTETDSLEVTDDNPGPKKRGRKKGSKSAKRQPSLEDSVKKKLASISRTSKLKTTQEIVAQLQAGRSNCNPISNTNALPSQSVVEPPNMEDVLRSGSNDQVSKYLHCSSQNLHRSLVSSETSSTGKTQTTRFAENWPEACQDRLREDDRSIGIDQPSTCRSPSHRDLTVEEILAKLPPLDPSSIDWGEDEEQNYIEGLPPPRNATAEDLERLHTQCIEGLNGNFQSRLSSTTACRSDGDEHSNVRDEENKVSGLSNVNSVKSVHNNQTDDAEFREWHQMLARSSYQGEILNILPYVIID